MAHLKNFLLAGTAAAFMAAAPLSAYAEDQSVTNQAETGEVELSGQEDIATAYDLYAYGEKNKDALAVITAAKIIATTPTTESKTEVEEKVEDGADTTEEGEGAAAPASLDDMLATATKLSAGNETYLELIEDVKAAKPRGRLAGPGRLVKGLLAGRTHIIRETFRGGRLAQITLIGDGDTNLDMVVLDQNGNAICRDRSYSDKLRCSFYPKWTGTFAIGIKNQGRIRNTYILLTN
ncbi:MAG: hypothetical protein AAGK38_00740 [Pseudomonadota bacterium]